MNALQESFARKKSQSMSNLSVQKPNNLMKTTPGFCISPDIDYPTQPQMMPFKTFLASQDENVTETEAIKRYNDYRAEFNKQQIGDFFTKHKDEEW